MWAHVSCTCTQYRETDQFDSALGSALSILVLLHCLPLFVHDAYLVTTMSKESIQVYCCNCTMYFTKSQSVYPNSQDNTYKTDFRSSYWMTKETWKVTLSYYLPCHYTNLLISTKFCKVASVVHNTLYIALAAVFLSLATSDCTYLAAMSMFSYSSSIHCTLLQKLRVKVIQTYLGMFKLDWSKFCLNEWSGYTHAQHFQNFKLCILLFCWVLFKSCLTVAFAMSTFS